MLKDFIRPMTFTTKDAEIAKKKLLYPATYNDYIIGPKTLSDKQISQMYVDIVIIGGGSIIDFAHKLIEKSQEC
jgi:hypothetical protein